MGEIFISADFHLSHRNIIKYSNRPFMSESEKAEVERIKQEFGDVWHGRLRGIPISDESIELMDTTIIDNINKTVGLNDNLWILGDFAFRDHAKHRSRIRCKNVFLTLGNHDPREDEFYDLFSGVCDMKEICWQYQKVTLCHYALRTWNSSHHGRWSLFGHSHGSLPDDPNLLSFDVGVDCWNYRPVSFDDAQKVMQKKTWKPPFLLD